MKIGFFGDGPWSHKSLEKLLSDKRYSVEFICVRFNNPDNFLLDKSRELGIDLLIEKNINEISFQKRLKKYKCDLFVSMSFDQIFKKETFNIPQKGTINCHAGKLPLYRGRNILNWALINGESEFGITVHFIDEGIDTGDIILQETFKITLEDNYKTLLEKAYISCPKLLIKAIDSIYYGNYTRLSQPLGPEHGIYCCKRMLGDELLNWNQSSLNIFNFIRALTYPGPAARTKIGGDEIKILKSDLINNAPNYIGIPGTLLLKDKKGFLVKTQDSFIRITKWEAPKKLKVGMRFR